MLIALFTVRIRLSQVFSTSKNNVVMKVINEAMTCALCLKQRELCESHIVPEFFYKNLYDDRHLAQLVEVGQDKEAFLRKGFREHLLCKECENFLNTQYESYVASVWQSKFPGQDDGEAYTVNGLDFARFKLFHLSVLWRASVSNLSFFKNVFLGKHEEKIRAMLLSKNPGRSDIYTISGSTSIYEGAPLHGVTEPVVKKIRSHTVYLFRFGGCLWRYWVASHSSRGLVANPFEADKPLVLPKIAIEDDYQLLRIVYESLLPDTIN